jgi:hypothetical protein
MSFDFSSKVLKFNFIKSIYVYRFRLFCASNLFLQCSNRSFHSYQMLHNVDSVNNNTSASSSASRTVALFCTSIFRILLLLRSSTEPKHIVVRLIDREPSSASLTLLSCDVNSLTFS